MISATPARRYRSAAISSSTIFAIALAIVAGLIFAWLFKMVLLDPKKAPPLPPDTRRDVTIAGVNILPNTPIAPSNIKTIKVSQDQFDAWTKPKPGEKARKLLYGQQPINRVTKKAILAESPIYEDDLEPFEYPVPVSSLIATGKKAVMIKIDPNEAMVQKDDYVDVWATLSNDALGAGGNGSAVIARNAKVVARFGTTAPGARPANSRDPRVYTLEVSPYRFALIELAKASGAKFSLAVSHIDPSSETPPVSDDPTDPPGDQLVRVTGRDLARLFGIGDPTPGTPPPPAWALERVVGIRHAPTMTFPGYQPRQSGGTVPASYNPSSSGVAPAGLNGTSNQSLGPVPVSYTPPVPAGTTLAFTPASGGGGSGGVAGFGAPKDPSAAACSN